MDITKEDFEKIILSVISEIPNEFKNKIGNLEFIVMDFPTEEMLKRSNIYGKGTLLGLYEGVPLAKRGRGYQGVLPDRIILFKVPILKEAALMNIPLRKKIKNVLLHEIGHYFGMSEEELRKMGVF